MRIGILTYHRSINYGAFMQCYSLSKRLRADFPEDTIEVIDYTSPKIMTQYRNRILNAATPEIREKLEAQTNAFHAAQTALPLSAWQCVSDDRMELAAHLNEHYDIVVVGSDAVWNWNVRGFPNGYFLKDYHGVKLSYAASAHGQDFRHMTPEQKKYLAEAFRDFSYLGVRDSSTEEMLHFIDPTLSAHHNCDPTLLLEADFIPCETDVLKAKLDRAGIDPQRPMVGVMASEDVVGKPLRNRLHPAAQMVALYTPNRWADAFLYDLTPFEWAKVFSLFGATVTHFFHGTLLSLVNGTPVFPIEVRSAYTDSYQTKIKDVLKRLELLQWYRQLDNGGIIRRGAKKIGLSVHSRLWNEVSEDVLSVLSHRSTNTEMILSAVKRERESYHDFQHALQKSISGLKEKNR